MATRLLSTQRVVNLASDPATGTAGELYYNTASNVFKYYNGTAWTEIVGGSEGASLTVSETAPSPASEGDLWLNSSTLKLLVYYDSFWVEIGGGGGGASLPAQTGNSGKYLTTNGTDASWGSITEDVQDIVGGMVSGNTESGISVTYDDTNGKLDFDVNDPTITLTGDITGSATMTNLGNVSISTTIAANSVELGTDTVGQYIASVSGTTNQVNVSGSGTESITLTLSTPQDIHSGASPTFAGATLDNITVGVTGANEIDTTSGNLTIDSAGGTVTIDDNLTVSGNLTVNGTTTTVNSTTLTVDDPIVTLAGDTILSTNDGKDRGVEFRYYDTESRLGFMGYNNSTGEFTLLLNATNTNEIFSGTKATLNAHISGSNINAGTVSAAYIDSAIARLASPTFTGTVIMPTSASGGASIRIPHGVAPTAPTDGDIWTTSSGVYVRVNGETVGPLGAGGGGGGGGVSYQITAPTSPGVGDVWVDSDETLLNLSVNDFATKNSPSFTGAATFNDGSNVEGRITSSSGVFYIQAGINSSDTSSVLTISRNSTTSTDISQFNVYANSSSFSGTISASSPTQNNHVATKEYVDALAFNPLLLGGM